MQDSPTNPPSEPLLALRRCGARLADGPWKFIRLRGSEEEINAIDGDDVDLLGTRESAETLLDAAFSWVRAGECHLRVRSGNRNKIGLHLISTDGKHRLDLDLWIELWQVDDRKFRLTHEGCAAAVLNPGDAIQRLPLELEASVFIHHLISKRKKISIPKQLARLAHYTTQCREAGHAELASSLGTTATSEKVNGETAALTMRLIGERLHPGGGGVTRLRRRIGSAISNAWFCPPGKLRMLGMMGCDGSGKTSLCKRLAKDRNDIRGIYTGKHLYRKWFVYKLLVIFVRPLLFQGREKFDDTFAPLAYLLASTKLFVKIHLQRKSTLLIDRSIMDFLMTGRKTDTPRFSRFRWLSSIFGIRLTHIHFIVPFERLKERKLEMTEKGHNVYDVEMFRHFSRRAPTDHIVFDNRGSLDESSEALNRMVDWVSGA
jgi:hypothetical protein